MYLLKTNQFLFQAVVTQVNKTRNNKQNNTFLILIRRIDLGPFYKIGQWSPMEMREQASRKIT